jgi:putative holliday junction resolvase
MKILGIDYGRRKIGIAISEAGFAEPLRVLRVQNVDDAIKKVSQVVQDLQVSKVVVGISEGEMGKESKGFSLSLSKKLSIPVSTYDETLTSLDAQRIAIEAGVSQKRRHAMEDAYAATLMLQQYVDSN